MKKLLCIAESCCDMIFGGLPRVPEPGREVYCREFEIKAGGGANTPMMLGRLGAPVRFLTRLGKDLPGRLVWEDLEACGVEIAGTGMTEGARTAVSAVLSTSLDRCFASYAGSAGAFFTPKQLEEEISRADIVHTYLGYCLTYPIARLCRRYDRILSLDVSWCDSPAGEETWEILNQCDYLKLNREEALALTGAPDPETAARKLAEKVRTGTVVTLGGEGSLGLCQGQSYRQRAIETGRFADACGAGDCYGAGFLYGIATGRSMKESMGLGAAAAGLCVTWYGGMDRGLDLTPAMLDSFL